MIKKLKLFKKILDLSKEFKKIKKENAQTFDEIGHFLESAKLLYPKLGGLIERIIELAKGNSDKKV